MRRYYRQHFLFVEFCFSVVICLIVVALTEWVWGRSEVQAFVKGNRQAAYVAIASTGGSLLGFAITAVSIVIAVGASPAMSVVRRSGNLPRVYEIFFQAICWLSLATIWAFIGLLADTDTNPRILIGYAMTFFFTVVLFRVFRCIWIMREVTSLLTAEAAKEVSANPTAS
ncbi:MAG: hypothetical protein U0793_27400 [Gemmataceae bacterium]